MLYLAAFLHYNNKESIQLHEIRCFVRVSLSVIVMSFCLTVKAKWRLKINVRAASIKLPECRALAPCLCSRYWDDYRRRVVGTGYGGPDTATDNHGEFTEIKQGWTLMNDRGVNEHFLRARQTDTGQVARAWRHYKRLRLATGSRADQPEIEGSRCQHVNFTFPLFQPPLLPPSKQTPLD